MPCQSRVRQSSARRSLCTVPAPSEALRHNHGNHLSHAIGPLPIGLPYDRDMAASSLFAFHLQVGVRVALRTLTPIFAATAAAAVLYGSPAVVFAPLAALLFLALGGAADDGRRRHLAYLVHNPAVRRRLDLGGELPLSDLHAGTKERAIRCHASQLVLRSPLLLSFATSTETYLPFPTPPAAPGHAVAGAERAADGGVTFTLRPRWRARAFGARTLLVAAGPELRLRIPLRGGAPPVIDLRDRSVLCRATLRTAAGGRRLTLPSGVVPPHLPLAAKLQRAIGFFDESGWLLLAPGGEPA